MSEESFLRDTNLEFLDSSGAVTTLTSSKTPGPPDFSFLELTGGAVSDGLQFGLTSDIQSQLYFKNATNTNFGFVRHTSGGLEVQSNNTLTIGGTTLILTNPSGSYTWPTVFPSADQVLSSGSTPGTLEWIDAGSGTTYEFLQAGLNATTAVPANAAAVPFDTTLANNGGITRLSGVFTLEANKTYKLTGALRTNIAVTADITYQWRDITNNTLLGTIGSTTSYTSVSNFSVNSTAQAFLSTTAATTVHLEIISGGSVGQLDASNCSGTIETQISGSGGGGGGSPPGGIDGSLQFKAGTSFDGNDTLLWDTANNRLLVAQQGSTTTPVTGLPTPNPFILDVRNTTSNDGAFINIQGTAASSSGFIFSDSTTNASNFFFIQSPVSSVLSAQTPFFLSSQSEVTVESSGDLIFKNSNATPYTWPTTVATANQVLSAGSSPGTMEWVSFNGTPGGSTTNVQFNTAGAFDGTDQFSWDPSNATEPRLLLSKNASDIAVVAPPPSPTPDDFVLDVRNDTGNCWVGVKAADRGGLFIQDPSNTILGLVYYNTNALLLESTNVLIQSSRLDFNAANTPNGILYSSVADGVTNGGDLVFDNTLSSGNVTNFGVRHSGSTTPTLPSFPSSAIATEFICNDNTDSVNLLRMDCGATGADQFILSAAGGTQNGISLSHDFNASQSVIGFLGTSTVFSITGSLQMGTGTGDMIFNSGGNITLNSTTDTSIKVGTNEKLLVANTSATPPTVPTSTLMQLYSDTTARFYLNYSGASSFGQINISDSSSLGLLISHTRGTESLIQSQESLRLSSNNDIILFNGLSDSISLSGGGVSIESVNSDLSFTNNLQTVKWPTNTPTENSVLAINNTSSPYTSEWRAPASGQIFEARMINQLTTGNNIYTIQSPSLNTTSITLSTNTLTITEPGLYQFTAIWSYTTGGNFNAFKFYNSTTAQFFGPFAFEGDGSSTLITNLEITGATNIQVTRDPSVPAAPNNFDGFAFPRGSLIIQRLSY